MILRCILYNNGKSLNLNLCIHALKICYFFVEVCWYKGFLSLYLYSHFIHIHIYILFIHNVLETCHIFYYFLSIFESVVLKYLSSHQVFWGQLLLIHFFFHLNGPYLPVSLYSSWFYFENQTFKSKTLVTLEIRFSPLPQVYGFLVFFLF